MNPKYYQTIPKKKKKTDLLLDDKYLKHFILDTREFSHKNLNCMLKEYDFVVFKPNIGGGGKYVGFIRCTDKGYYVQLGTDVVNLEDVDKVHQYVNNLSTKRKFILQKGVELLKYDDAPFDIRIEIQKPYDNWAVTGIVAKFAGQNKMVTNRHSGGTGILLEKVFNNINLDKISEIKSMLTFIGLRCSRELNKHYDGLREVGIDIGLDENYHAYILEVNTKPQFGVFRQAGDKEMLKRIEECNKIILNSIEYIVREL